MTSAIPAYDLLVAAPNPALDSYFVVPALSTGAVNRAEQVLHTAGGKGNNLARAAVCLGGRVLSLGILGGQTGERIRLELDREGIDAIAVPAAQETRQCITLIRRDGGENTVVLDSGAVVSGPAGSDFAAMVLKHSPRARWIVFNGSLPPGVGREAYGDWIAALRQQQPGARIALDSGGDGLRYGALAGPAVVKVNVEEILQAFAPGEAWSLPLGSRIAAELASMGVELLIVTDGPRGAFAFPAGREPLHVATPVTTWISTAGAGDSFLAALLLALGRGESLEMALMDGSAAAAASLEQVVCGQIDRATYQRLRATTRLRPVSTGVTA